MMKIVIEVGVWTRLCWRERKRDLSVDIPSGGYRNRGLEKAVLEREHSDDVAAGGSRSRGL